MVQQHFLQEDNQAFATYLMLEEYPELKEIAKYRNPSCNSKDSIKQEYEKIKEYANENNIDITKYTDIVDKGYSYVSDNFSWESTGYYWKVSGLNEVVDNGCTVDDHIHRRHSGRVGVHSRRGPLPGGPRLWRARDRIHASSHA